MQMLNRPAVVTRNLRKTFFVPRSQNPLDLIFRSRQRPVEAVKGVSFAVEKGESIGILGKNGSGKSTLLRLIAGMETPTEGEVFVSAKPSLLGVSAALQPKLTGYQNIRLGLLATGNPPKQVDELLPSIADLTGLEEALSRPMHTYSSGMQARLVFAIATSREPEILMIDEALGTGDATFNEIASKRMEEMLESSGTIFVVSHSAKTIRRNCERCIWLHDGVVVTDGLISDISPEYAKWGEAVTLGKIDRANEIIDFNLRNSTTPKLILRSETV